MRPDVSFDLNQEKRSDTDRMRASNLCEISGSLVHFERTNIVLEDHQETYCARFRKDLGSLLKEFQDRFSDFVRRNSEFILFADPFSIIIDTAPVSMQLELVELPNSEILKTKHRESASPEFHGALDISSFPMLRRQAMKLPSLPGRTYTCE